MEKESHLIIFEEKIELSDLNDRERQAYEIGIKEGRNNPSTIDFIQMILMWVMFFLLGITFCNWHPEWFK